jgi:hypothetical protein
MRIIIETDGAAEPTLSPALTEADATQEALDAGAGPGGAEGDALVGDSGEDAGGPPQSLVDEIARASGHGAWGDSDDSATEDGGAGPGQ